MLRVGDVEHIAVTGCTPGACRTQRGLLLIRADGQELRARIDEGGFTHHYAFGAGLAAATQIFQCPRDTNAATRSYNQANS